MPWNWHQNYFELKALKKAPAGTRGPSGYPPFLLKCRRSNPHVEDVFPKPEGKYLITKTGNWDWENSVQIGLVQKILIFLQPPHISELLLHSYLSFNLIERLVGFTTTWSRHFLPRAAVPRKTYIKYLCMLFSSLSVLCQFKSQSQWRPWEGGGELLPLLQFC